MPESAESRSELWEGQAGWKGQPALQEHVRSEPCFELELEVVAELAAVAAVAASAAGDGGKQVLCGLGTHIQSKCWEGTHAGFFLWSEESGSRSLFCHVFGDCHQILLPCPAVGFGVDSER